MQIDKTRVDFWHINEHKTNLDRLMMQTAINKSLK